MAFQPTSPTRRYSDYRRAVQVRRKRTASMAKSEKASIAMASPPPDGSIPEHSQPEPTPPAAAAGKTAASDKAPAGGLARSGSLSDRLRSSWKGGVSSLLKKSQDNVRADAIAKARRSKDAQATTSSPGSAKGDAKSKTKASVQLPSALKSHKETKTNSTTNPSILKRSESPRFTPLASPEGVPPPVPPKSPPGVPGQLQPGSFFNDDSSDEEDESPVLQRASSVHVGKPTLVRHYSNATASQAVKRGNSPAPRSGLSQEESAAKETNDDNKAAEDGTADLNPSHAAGPSEEGPEDALSRLEGSPTKPSSSKPLPLTPAPQISPSKPLVASPSTYSSTLTSFSDSQATGNIISPPAPAMTTSTGNHPAGTPFPTPLSPLSALHSNPVSPSTVTAVTGSRLSRALSAPTAPNRNANRRVTIRPSDLVINHSEHDHKLFRDSIVTTPYPERGSGGSAKNRLSDIPDGQEGVEEGQVGEGGEDGNPNENENDGDVTPRPSMANEDANGTSQQQQRNVTLLDPSTSIPMSPHGPGDRDRFPSLTSSESFLLTLSIAGHPTLTKTIEIEVPTPSSSSPTAAPTPSATLSLRTHRRKTLTKPIKPFDDAALFALLRTHYTSLLGPRRLLLTRTLHHATPSTPDTPLDATSFLAHLRNPSLGTENRHWLLWLRNQQPISKRASSLFSGPAPTTSGPNGNGHLAPYVPGGMGTGAMNSPTYPRMPFQRSETRNSPPQIVLHFRHNALTISLAVAASLVIGGIAVVIWVLLGVPGLGASDAALKAPDFSDGVGSVFDALSNSGDGDLDLGGLAGGGGRQDVVRTGGSYYGDWRVDSQMRVLTGLVLGLAVAGGGVLVTAAWGLMGWILL